MRKVLSIAVVIGAALVLALPARGLAEEPVYYRDYPPCTKC